MNALDETDLVIFFSDSIQISQYNNNNNNNSRNNLLNILTASKQNNAKLSSSSMFTVTQNHKGLSETFPFTSILSHFDLSNTTNRAYSIYSSTMRPSLRIPVRDFPRPTTTYP